MIDNTFGAGTLEKLAEQVYNGLDEETQFKEFQLTQEFKKEIQDSWLINLLCQYNSRNSFVFGDMLWYRTIKQMIIEGTLYMAIFYVDNWAFRDNQIENNLKNIEPLGLTINLEDKRNSDGLFIMDKPLKMYKIYPSDDETPEDMEFIEIESPHGVIEFGTQKICKSAMSLKMNDMLMRVPYKTHLNFKTPICAIFYNTKSYTEYL